MFSIKGLVIARAATCFLATCSYTLCSMSLNLKNEEKRKEVCVKKGRRAAM